MATVIIRAIEDVVIVMDLLLLIALPASQMVHKIKYIFFRILIIIN